MANIYNSKNNITFRNIVDTFRTIAENHFQLNSFKSGSLNDVDIDKMDLDKFPLLYAEPQPATVDIGTLTYTFDIIVADRIKEDMTDLDDAYSETLQITINIMGR